jgi:hypothetical protein
MNDRDPVLARLAALPVGSLDAELGARIRRLAQPKLLPRPVSVLWTLAVSASVVGYLGWALAFAADLVASR